MLYNPSAGIPARTQRICEKFLQELRKCVSIREVFTSHSPRDVKNLVEKVSAPALVSGWLLVLGGDGTLNSLVGWAKALQYLTIIPVPVGSGNGFARYLGFRTWKDSLRYVCQYAVRLSPKNAPGVYWRPLRISTEKTAQIFALNMVGAGVSAKVARAFAQDRARTGKGGLGLYVRHFFREIFRDPHPVRGSVFIRTSHQHRMVSLQALEFCVCLGNQWGNGFYAHPFSMSWKQVCRDQWTNHQIACVWMYRPSPLILPLHLAMMFLRKHRNSCFWQGLLLSEDATLTLNMSDSWIHVDGESLQAGNSFRISLDSDHVLRFAVVHPPTG